MPDELGLLVRAVASQIVDLDWLVLRTFDADPSQESWAVVAEDVYGVDPVRAVTADDDLNAWIDHKLDHEEVG